MAATESLSRNPFPADRLSPTSLAKPIPIITSASSPSNASNGPRVPQSNMSYHNQHQSQHPPESMDITPTSAVSMPPPTGSPPSEMMKSESRPNGESLEGEPPTNNGANHANGNDVGPHGAGVNGVSGGGNARENGSVQPLGAAASAQPTKVVQTAFIHKLYSMLEDGSIQHLISWSASGESFVMCPSTEFAKVLSQYFKHTNISSFVRQLNMYGFHKVSDVFHTGAPDSTLWEFRHGNGSFKRGDLMGLREIKRRASRHQLIHRDSFPSNSKALAPAQPVNPQPEVLPEHQNPIEHRMAMLEQSYCEVYARLRTTEETIGFLTSRCQVLTDGLMRSHQWNQELAHYLASALPDGDSQTLRDINMMHREISRQADALRNVEQTTHAPQSHAEPNPPLSPRQMPNPDYHTQRRPSHPSLFEHRTTNHASSFRHPTAPHLSISPRRYGSIGSSNNSYSPSSGRGAAPPPPPPPPSTLSSATGQHPQYPHPLSGASGSSPPCNLSRRHTSADIRQHGWPPHSSSNNNYSSQTASTPQWPPSSPTRAPAIPAHHSGPGGGDNQAIRDALAQYELPPRGGGGGSGNASRQLTPPSSSIPPGANGPAPHTNPALDPVIAPVAGTGPDSAWAVPGSRFPGWGKTFGGEGGTGSGPPTRRSSMASNLHGLLNPAGEGGEEGTGDAFGDGNGNGKRKRVV